MSNDAVPFHFQILGKCLWCAGKITRRFIGVRTVKGRRMANKWNVTCSEGGDACVERGVSAAVLRTFAGEAPPPASPAPAARVPPPADRFETVCVNVIVVKHETDLALLCVVDAAGGHYTEWFPKSQIAPFSQVKAIGDSGTLLVPKWLCVEKGIPFNSGKTSGQVFDLE